MQRLKGPNMVIPMPGKRFPKNEPLVQPGRMSIYDLLLEGKTEEVEKMGNAAIPALVKCLGDWTVRESAAKVLEHAGISAVPAIMKALGDERTRVSATVLLGKLVENHPEHGWEEEIAALIKDLATADLAQSRAGLALGIFAEKLPDAVAGLIIRHVNGTGGDSLVEINSRNEWTLNRLHEILLACGKGMEHAKA